MAIGPIQYLPQTDPFAGVAESFQFGQQIRQMRDARAAQEQAKALEDQYRTDVTNVLQNPSARGFSELIAKYPKSREAFEASWKGISEEQRQGELRDTGEIIASLTTGNPDAAIGKIQSRIELMDKQGADSSQLKAMLDQIKTDPKSARSYLMFTAAHLPGGDKLLENIGKIEEQQRKTEAAPLELEEQRGKAIKSRVEADLISRFGEQSEILRLQREGWNIKKIQEDIGIAKESNRIAAMNAAANREGNDLKREELRMKIKEAQSNIDSKLREKVATVESGAQNIDNMLNTVDRILQNPELPGVLGTFQGRAPVIFSDRAADAVALIDTLGSQAFLSQIPTIKGTGALSNAEGEKLQSALQNLSRVQTESQFRTNLKEAQRLLLKSRSTLEKQYGVKAGVPDTPAVNPSGNEIDALIQKYGG